MLKVSRNGITVFAVGFAVIFTAVGELKAAGRTSLNFNTHWKYYFGNPAGAEKKEYNDGSWDNVSLPYSIRLEPKRCSANNSYQGTCWYRRHFYLPDSYSGKKVFVEFEGSMITTDVYVNGTLITTHRGGYLPFTVDITDRVVLGGTSSSENVIAVKVTNNDDPDTPPGKLQKDLDYCYFGGIFRDVRMHITDKLHITDAIYANKVAGGGIFVTYPSVSTSSATVQVKTNVRNEYSAAKNCSVKTTIVDTDNQVVASNESTPQSIGSGSDYTFTQSLTLSSPRLWHPNHPYRYSLVTSVNDGAGYVDENAIRVGIRRIRCVPDGFFINDEKVFLNGADPHEEYLYVGGAMGNSMLYRDALKLREAGFNSVRLAHHPFDPAFMDACDELGIMVVSPTPAWQFFGNATFQERSLQMSREMVRRDRNRPCVILWEAQLNETSVTADFAVATHTAIHEEYPGDQCFTAVRNDYASAATFDVSLGFLSDYTKKACFEREYGDVWSEDAWTTTGLRCSRIYGEMDLYNSVVGRHKELDNFLKDPRDGFGLWSYNDYNRGATWLANNAEDLANTGVVDVDRYPKFSYYLYQSQRDPNFISPAFNSGPMVSIANYWTSSSPTNVRIFSNCEQVKLYLNDNLIGAKNPDTGFNTIWHPMYSFTVTWASGTLRADGLIGGVVKASDTVRTPGTPDHLELAVDDHRIALVADGADMVMVYAHIKDANGTTVPTAANTITFSATGPGVIVGDGEARISANPCKAEAGIAPFLIKSTQTPGTITVTANATGLKSAATSITSTTLKDPIVPLSPVGTAFFAVKAREASLRCRVIQQRFLAIEVATAGRYAIDIVAANGRILHTFCGKSRGNHLWETDASGVYIVSLKTDTRSFVRKIVIKR